MTLKTWYILVTHQLEAWKESQMQTWMRKEKKKHNKEIEETISRTVKQLNLGRNLFFFQKIKREIGSV